MALPNEHAADGKHDNGDVLVLSTIRRFTSRNVDAFEVPGGREEEWRFTPLKRLRGLHDGTASDGGSHIYGWPMDEVPGDVDVRVVPRDDPGLGVAVAPADRVAAQAWCTFTRALVVSVPRDAVVDEPIIVHVAGSGEGRTTYGHIAVKAGRFSRATVVVDYRGSGTYAENVELITEDSADLTVLFLNEWNDDAVHVSAHHTSLGRSSKLRHVVVTLGGDVVRISPTLTFTEEGADAELDGLCFAQRGQHFEHRPIADHAARRCTSLVNYKCAAHGNAARSVWIGNALVRTGAEDTDTYQANRNILLTKDARADAVPSLEIEISNIRRAGHESATGRFDDEQLFYLMSRGLTEPDARRLVLRGFFNDVIARIGVESLEDRVRTAIEQRLALVE
jgi:Fe-S cluster assembly protein SufD